MEHDLTGYKWSEDTATCERLVSAVNWPNVQAYASSLHKDEPCSAEAPIGIGGRHFVRILTFEGGERWLARFLMPSRDANRSDDEEDSKEENDLADDNGSDNENDTGDEDDTGEASDLDDENNSHSESELAMLREADCLRLVAERTTIPVPKLFAVVSRKPEFGPAFMLMECLPGNVGMDINFDFIPEQFKASFFKQMANAHVQMSSIMFPRIGTPVRLEDGTMSVEAIPDIGGPFDTASAFFRAWAAAATYRLSEEKVKEYCGDDGDEIWDATASFPARLSEMAGLIAGPDDKGPFPLVHVDFGHNNIVVDTQYNILGVIDWEYAIAAPWGMVEYPLTVRITPKPMDAPWNYTSDGLPKDADFIADHKDREDYLQAVMCAERELGAPPKLSEVLSNEKVRDVSAAMKLYNVDGKMGWYSRVLDAFEGVAGS